MSRRCILVHVCGSDRTPYFSLEDETLEAVLRRRTPCTCSDWRIEVRKAERMVARGRAIWWRRRNVNGRWVQVRDEIALVSNEWPRTRLRTQRDVEVELDAEMRIQDLDRAAAGI